MSEMPRRAVTRRGFTLVELLVVIGIIALLVAMLMPALTRARQHAQMVQCMSNLRNFGLGLRMYAHDNNGVIVGRIGGYPGSPGLPTLGSWCRSNWPTGLTFHRYLGGISPTAMPADYTDPGAQLVTEAAQRKLFCPSMVWVPKSDPTYDSMQGNDGWSQEMAYGMFDWVYLDLIRNPANVFLVGDAFGNNAANKGAVFLFFENRTPAGGVTAKARMWFGHLKRATVLMADGHVDALLEGQVPVQSDYPVPSGYRYPGYTAFWRSIKFKNQQFGTINVD